MEDHNGFCEALFSKIVYRSKRLKKKHEGEADLGGKGGLNAQYNIIYIVDLL